MTEVLLIGTFHFFEKTDFDVNSPKIQDELNFFVNRFIHFNADAIAVEKTVLPENKAIDISNYDFSQHSDESYQVGARFAKIMNLSVIHPIDIKMPLDAALIDTDGMEKISKRLNWIENEEKKYTNIIDIYKFVNSEKYINEDRNAYLDLNSINNDKSYIRSRFLAKWYERNLCIFSNLQHLAEQYKRIFIIYGAGHLTILRDLINESDSMLLRDINEYLD